MPGSTGWRSTPPTTTSWSNFCATAPNKRTDRYGGSVENRLRFPLEVAAAVVDVWGGDRVGIRISPGTTMPGGAPLDSNTMDTYGRYIDALNGFGLAYLHMIEGTTQQTRETEGVDYQTLRCRFTGRFIDNNLLTAEMAEQELEKREIDAVAFGRPFIANPDLVHRLRVGGPLAEAPKRYWYGGGEVGYSDWPGMDTKTQASY